MHSAGIGYFYVILKGNVIQNFGVNFFSYSKLLGHLFSREKKLNILENSIAFFASYFIVLLFD